MANLYVVPQTGFPVNYLWSLDGKSFMDFERGEEKLSAPFVQEENLYCSMMFLCGVEFVRGDSCQV